MAEEGRVFRATPQFHRSFDALSPDEQRAAKAAFKVFKINPFDPSLKTHKINRLTSLARRAIYSVIILPNLRALFYLDGNRVVTLDIGTHEIYDKSIPKLR